MFKKIIIIISLFIIFISSVFADISVELSSNKTSAIVNEDFTLDIKVKNDWGKDLNIESIGWIENFNKVSQRNFFSSSNINWVVTIETSLQFVLNWINPWEYIIWPVILNDWENKYSSNNIKIIIKDELVNNDWIKDDINPVKKINLFSKNFLYSPTFIFLFFILIVSIYLLIKKPKQEEENIQNEPDKIELIKNELSKLKNEIDETEKNIFYSKLNIIFRKYFENIWIIWASQLTLKELETKQIDNEIFNLFKKSYSGEFSNYKDAKKSREKIIEEFEKILG